MTPESGLAPGPRILPDAPPELSGWGGAASAVHAIRQMAMPMTLRLDLGPDGVVAIDFGMHAYEWDGHIAELPASPPLVLVETRPAPPDGRPSIEPPGKPLDPLLWTIGWHAFGDAPAPWLRPGERYRLRRWPSLTDIQVSLDQVRMIAMLGNAFANAAELAAAAGTSSGDAQRLINGFAVLGILRRSTGAGPIPQPALPAGGSAAQAAPRRADSPGGLFARLRERWGR